MKLITKQKSIEEIKQSLENEDSVYLVGCGTCATMCHTGGKAEVLKMKDALVEMGKTVVGWMVIPTSCDDLTAEALKQDAEAIEKAGCILAMSCALGVQTIARSTDKRVCPAQDTLFMGVEESPGNFSEVCKQCGECVLAWTGGICPVVACHKGLLNGPCGGTNEGKCEVDPDKDCAWTLIYQRLEKLGRLDLMREYRGPKDHQAVVRPGKITIK
ncbi:methylenetetrahydrofolate reductase C-terminal domain-containing protein [Chloroflexota bacterium]